MGDDAGSEDDERVQPEVASADGSLNSVSTTFEMLSNHRRRYVLYYLSDTEGPADIDALSAQVAEWENEKTDADIGDSARKRVYISLAHSDLPKLADFGIVDYDVADGSVSLHANAEQLDRYLDIARDGEMND